MKSALTDLQFQLAWNRLLAIVEEQAQVLMRTAFSTVVREAGDLSAGVFDTKGQMLAQAVTGTPGHVNAMARAVGNFLVVHPLGKLKEGDVLLTNDPWLATGHLNDFTVVTPVFQRNRPVALFASTSHIADVGGRGFGPDANEVFEEGLRVPITHLFKKGDLNQTLMELVKANVRDPVIAEGDLYSLTTCNQSGSTQLLETMEEFGLDSLSDLGSSILQLSKSAMEQEISKLPNSTYRHSMTVDGYDEPVEIQCALTINAKDILIDFSGSSGISDFGINVPLPYTEAYASFGVRCLVGNEIPNNAGSLETIRVTAPEHCILNAKPPCAVSARHALGQMLPDVVIACLGEALNGEVPAEGASCIWNPVFMSLNTPNVNAPSDQFVINPIFNGGTGARINRDGLSTTAFPSGVRTTPTEVNEVTAPLIFWEREFLQDSGGEGEYQGGAGQRIQIEHAHGASFAVSKMFDRVNHPARGKDGGQPGSRGRVYLKGGEEFRGKGKEKIPGGEILVLETPGGGGSGSPTQRNPELVSRDVKNGLISKTEASRIYGYTSQD